MPENFLKYHMFKDSYQYLGDFFILAKHFSHYKGQFPNLSYILIQLWKKNYMHIPLEIKTFGLESTKHKEIQILQLD